MVGKTGAARIGLDDRLSRHPLRAVGSARAARAVRPQAATLPAQADADPRRGAGRPRRPAGQEAHASGAPRRDRADHGGRSPPCSRTSAANRRRPCASTRRSPASPTSATPTTRTRTSAAEADEGDNVSKIAVFGAGSWGTAFSLVLADAGNDVVLWARREELSDAINNDHENPDYLPGVALADSISATHDPEEALAGAGIVVLAVPSQSLRANLEHWAKHIRDDAVVMSLMKGVELGTLKRMSEVDRRGRRARSGAGRRADRSQPLARDRRPSAGSIGRRLRRRVGRRAAPGALPHARPCVSTPTPTWSAASSVAPPRTSSRSPSVWRTASDSATTRRPP